MGTMAAELAAGRAGVPDLGVPVSDVNVKAKTAERLGAVGRGEGIVAEAVVLIDRVEASASGD